MNPSHYSNNTPLGQPLLEFKDVSFSYSSSSGNLLLNKISFDLYQGQKIGIVGDNGSGKSTILKLILGVHNIQKGKGQVKLFCNEVAWGNHYPNLGYIGDPSYNPGELGLPTGISVKELVYIFKSLWNQHDSSKFNRIEERLKIPCFYDCNVGQLSKGQRMRLMAFLALSKKTDLLIADEATEGLDKEGKAVVLSEVQEAAERQNFGLLWISHRRDEVAMLTQDVYELNQGKLTRQFLQGFECEIQTDSLTSQGQKYSQLCKDGAFQVLGEIFTDTSISKFSLQGQKKIGGMGKHEV